MIGIKKIMCIKCDGNEGHDQNPYFHRSCFEVVKVLFPGICCISESRSHIGCAFAASQDPVRLPILILHLDILLI